MTFTNGTDVETYTPSLTTMTTGKIGFWFYMDNTAAEARILTANTWALRRSGAGQLHMIDNDTGNTLLNTGFNDGAWHHMWIIKSGGTDITIRIDNGVPITVSNVANLLTISGLTWGATTHLTGTYSGTAATGVYIDSFTVQTGTGAGLPTSAEKTN